MGDFNADVNSFKMRRRDVELLRFFYDCNLCVVNLLESSYLVMNTVLLLTTYACENV